MNPCRYGWLPSLLTHCLTAISSTLPSELATRTVLGIVPLPWSPSRTNASWYMYAHGFRLASVSRKMLMFVVPITLPAASSQLAASEGQGEGHVVRRPLATTQFVYFASGE